jgi:glycosyltransferase involved in cell wall biosynthesis
MGILKKINTACRIVKEEGMYVMFYKFKAKFGIGSAGENAGIASDDEKNYKNWIKKNETDLYKFDESKIPYKPLISVVVPVYNVSTKMLKECIMSVLDQTYANWELCLADDASTMPEVRKCLKSFEDNTKIKIKYREKNGHISRCTNTAIKMATGEYIAFMDCDDVLAPNALYEVVKLLNQDKSLDFIYSDEDKLSEDGKHRHQPHFKPDWSPDTMMSLMYTCHLGVYRKRIGDELEWLRTGFEGAQDYDLTLRFTEKTKNIGHVTKILYHWRERKESTAINPEAKGYIVDAARKTKEEALKRRGYEAQLEWVDNIYQFRVNYKPVGNPKISVIIPSKDNFDVYKRCIETLTEKTKYKNYEIVTVDNGSSEENRKKYEQYNKDKAQKYIYKPMDFNFSKMCNIGVENSDGELVLLLNDDMEIIDGEWMERMAGHAMLPYTGAVGAKLLYPNSTLIQHTGVFSFDSGPSHALCRYDDNTIFNFCRNKIEYNYSAVTAACLMVTREKYLEVGGLDESFAVAYNDVKFCFDLLEKGYYNVVRTDAVLYHHESLSRGSDVLDKAKYERLLKERRRLYDIHPSLEGKDPFYNTNLTMRRGDCTVEGGLDNLENIVLNLQSKDCLEKRKSNFIKGSIENIVVTGKYMLVSGWCINEKSRWNNFIRAKILLVCDDKIFELKTQKMYREHMNELTGINGKNNLSCFRVYFDSNQLPSRKYNIYIKKGKYIFDSSRILEKVKSVY